jgi:uncharacterized protein (DUF2384 family)
MEQPITLRWKSEERYCSAMLTPDLFGGWTLVTSSGARDGRGGRAHEKPVDSYQKGLENLRQLRHRRRHEGYELCGGGFAEFDGLDPHGGDLRAAESNALLRVFELWQLAPDEQANLLRVDARALNGYLDGRPLADDAELLARVGHVLAVHKVLRLRYGERPDFIREWLRLPNVGLDGRRPLDMMLGSPDGLADLRLHLDREKSALRTCPQGPGLAS